MCAKKYTLNNINSSIKNWLLGKSLENIDDLYHTDDDDDSPFWSRIYSDMDEWDEETSIKSFRVTLNDLKNIKLKKTSVKKEPVKFSHMFIKECRVYFI